MFGDHQLGMEYAYRRDEKAEIMQKYKVPFNAYFRYLQAMYDKYPVITAEGIIDKEGNYREKNDAVLQQEIHDYEYVMYYRLTGTGNEYEDLFGY